MDDLVFPAEYDPRQPIELAKLDRRRRIARDEADDAALDLGRRAKIVLADVHRQVDLRIQLNIRGEARPELSAGSRDEPHRELALEHQDRDAEEGAVREEAEDEGRGDLVWCVGDADVEVRERGLYEVADDDLQLALLRPTALSAVQKRRGRRLTFPVLVL